MILLSGDERLIFSSTKIVDEETGEKLGANEIGEICVKSPFTMKEYLKRPKVKPQIQSKFLNSGSCFGYSIPMSFFHILIISGDRGDN